MTGSVPATGSRVFATLLPVTVAVFLAFLTIGMQLPVLPLHLKTVLGMGPVMVGVVVGAQFAAALLSRAGAGTFADLRGSRRAVWAGLVTAAASGVVTVLSLPFVGVPALSVAVLLLGRVVLAVGESLIITGALGWGVGLVGPQNAGKVMVWNGIAIYGAFALGAPLGVAVSACWGMTGVGLATVVLPLAAGLLLGGMRTVAPSAVRRTPFYRVLGAVWVPGLGLALSSIGLGVISAFAALLFTARGWGDAGLVFTAFGVAFILARLLFGSLPDRLGGARVALVSVMIEAVGMLVIWGAETAAMACLGAALTGFGYSLAFPGFGVEAVRRAQPQTRGLAMGAYVAFLDLALGITGPLAGVLADRRGLAAVFAAGAVAVALSALVALRLWMQSRPA